MRKTLVAVSVAALALAGCGGPSAQQRRACEFFTEAGGDLEQYRRYPTQEESKASMAKLDAKRAENEALNKEYMALLNKWPGVEGRGGGLTPDEAARFEELRGDLLKPAPVNQDRVARDTVAQRLTMTQAEVFRALYACGKELK